MLSSNGIPYDQKNPPTVTNYKHQTSFKFKKLPSRKTNNTPFNLKKNCHLFPSHPEFFLFFPGRSFFFQVNPTHPFYRLVEKLKQTAPSSCMILGPKGLRRRCFGRKSVNLRTVSSRRTRSEAPRWWSSKIGWPGRFVLAAKKSRKEDTLSSG